MYPQKLKNDVYKKRLACFLKTQATPPIYYLPVKNDAFVQKLLEKSQAQSTEESHEQDLNSEERIDNQENGDHTTEKVVGEEPQNEGFAKLK